MPRNAAKMRLEDLEIKPQLITQLKSAGIESIFDLAVFIPYNLIEDGDGTLTRAGVKSRKHSDSKKEDNDYLEKMYQPVGHDEMPFFPIQVRFS